MSRESKEDLELLNKFISSFNLKSISASPDYSKLLSQQHHRYLALLTLLAELETQCKAAGKGRKRNLLLLPSDQQLQYLREAASDIGQALFCWIQGGYKGCRIILRSSIEVFVKGISCEDAPTVLTEKSLYKAFEFAGLTPFFATNPGKALFTTLNGKYGELSSDVHTASIANMAKISSLGYFPTFDSTAAKSTSNHLIVISTQIIVALCIRFNEGFHKMHHRNKETVMEVIPSPQRRRIQNVE